MEHSQKKTVRLRYIGTDSWSRYVYQDENGKLWKLLDCSSSKDVCEQRGDTLYSVCYDDFDGEPDWPMPEAWTPEYIREGITAQMNIEAPNGKFMAWLKAEFNKYPLLAKSNPISMNELCYVLRMSGKDFSINWPTETGFGSIPSVQNTFVPSKTLAGKVIVVGYDEDIIDGVTYASIEVRLFTDEEKSLTALDFIGKVNRNDDAIPIEIKCSNDTILAAEKSLWRFDVFYGPELQREIRHITIVKDKITIYVK